MNTLVSKVEAIAGKAPDRIALVDGERRMSYGALWAQSLAFADALRQRGLQPGDRVAIILPNRIEAVVAMYGAWLAGGVGVPLNAQARERDLTPWLAHCGARHVVHEATHVDAIAAVEAMPQLEFAWALQAAQGITPDPVTLSNLHPSPIPETPALILYTSGTTGAPKGVTLSHANLLANAQAVVNYLELSASDSVLGMLPFYYAYGASVLHTHLLSGARVVIAPNFLFPHQLMEAASQERVTGLSGVPSTFALLLDRVKLDDFDLSALRYLTQAGGAMAPALASRLRAALPQPRLFVMYGQTEATSRLTWLPPERLDEKTGSVGIPIEGVQLRVMREDGQPATPGEEGDVQARGPNVMLGYWNAPDATAAALQDGWLRTGDTGHFDEDGFLYLAGRRSDMIKTGAHRVYPGDIEEAISELATVAEVAVVGTPDDLLGQVVTAYVVARSPLRPEDKGRREMEIKAHCRARLAQYKIPRHIQFVDALPKTASGKVRRVALTQPMATAA